MKSRGLGDDLERLFKITGIKSMVEFLFGDKCGCNERRDYLNRKYPKKQNIINCLTEDDYYWLKKFFITRSNQGRLKPAFHVSPEEQLHICRIINYVYNQNIIPTSCESCRMDRCSTLFQLYLSYKNQ